MAERKHPMMANGQAWDRQKVMDHVCNRLAASSEGVVSILAAGYEGFPLPDYSTLTRWFAVDDELRKQYARAKEDQADYMAEEILDIADDATNDWMERRGKDGGAVGYELNGEHVQRSKLRIESRKWLMGKLRPKRYGDKLELSGDPESPIAISEIKRTIVDPRQ